MDKEPKVEEVIEEEEIEEEEEEPVNIEELLKERGYVSEEELAKRLEGYEPKKTRAVKKSTKKKEKKEPKTEKIECPIYGCGGELIPTTQGWHKCQKCQKGFFIRG